MFPEYFRLDGRWCWPRRAAWTAWRSAGGGEISIVEFRSVKAGDPVAVGRTEDGSQGIYVHTGGFGEERETGETFSFRQGRSRETAYSMDYDSMYELLRHEREHGNIPVGDGPRLHL